MLLFHPRPLLFLCLGFLSYFPVWGQGADTLIAHSCFIRGKIAYDKSAFETAAAAFDSSAQSFLLTQHHRRSVEAALFQGESLLNIGKRNEAGQVWQNSENLRQEFLPQAHDLQAQLANNLGVVSFYQGKLQAAAKHLQLAKSIWDTLTGVETEAEAALLSNLAILKENLGDLPGSYQMLREAQEIALLDSTKNLEKLTTICANISHLLNEMGDFEESLYYANRGSRLGLSILDSLDFRMNAVYNNRAIALMANGNVPEYLKCMEAQKAITLNLAPPRPGRLLTLQASLAGGLYRMGEFEESEKQFQILSEQMKEAPAKALNFAILGILFDHCYRERKPESFAPFWQVYAFKSENARIESRVKYHSDRAINAWMLGNPDSAAVYIQRAVVLGTRDFYHTDFYTLPEVKDVLSFVGFEEVCYRKALIAKAFWQRDQKSLCNLKFAFDCLMLGIEADVRFRSFNAFHREGTYALNRRRRLHALAIELAFLLSKEEKSPSWLHKAFQIMERGKAVKLRDAVKDHLVSQQAGIPDSLRQAFGECREALHLQRARVRAAYQSGDKSRIQAAEQRQIQLLNQQEKWGQSIKEVAPNFYQTRLNWELPDADSLFRYLNASNTVLLSFYEGLDKLYVLGACRGRLIAHQVPNQQYFAALTEFEEAVSQPGFILDPVKSYRSLSRSGLLLYQRLLAPVLDSLDKEGYARLLLIPDKRLSQFPFAALLTEEAPANSRNWKNWPYLIHRFDIALSYGWGLQARLQAKKMPFLGEALVFAPEFGPQEPNLEGANREGKAIANLISGKLLEGKEATETAFWENGQEYRILHFATHGKTDVQVPTRSYLKLGKGQKHDGFLYAYELLGANLGADLVVLSACESGSGGEKMGEGPMSLARAMRYAGCPSTVMNLWKVPDEESAILIENFYRGLQKGLGKDQALGQAQRNYLTSCDEIHAHPYYWAGPTVVGSRERLNRVQSRAASLKFVALIFLLLCLLIFVSLNMFKF